MASVLYGFDLTLSLNPGNIIFTNDYLCIGYTLWISNNPAIYK